MANLSTRFDAIGNLTSRSDNYGASENFCYDALNRLTDYAVGGPTCLTGTTGLVKSMAYDDIGNIVSKSDLAGNSTGNYAYPAAGQALPHAVSSIAGRVNAILNPKYKYDADGNLTCEYTGANCSGGAITRETDVYWSFNMAHTITDGATALTLTYDSEHARVTQALTTASTATTTTYLNDPINGAMGEKVATGSTTTWNDYLMVDGKLIGERTCTASGSSCTTGATLQYFVLDHLGSVAVVMVSMETRNTLPAARCRRSPLRDNSATNPEIIPAVPPPIRGIADECRSVGVHVENGHFRAFLGLVPVPSTWSVPSARVPPVWFYLAPTPRRWLRTSMRSVAPSRRAPMPSWSWMARPITRNLQFGPELEAEVSCPVRHACRTSALQAKLPFVTTWPEATPTR